MTGGIYIYKTPENRWEKTGGGGSRFVLIGGGSSSKVGREN
jgi:hypothetical protein